MQRGTIFDEMMQRKLFHCFPFQFGLFFFIEICEIEVYFYMTAKLVGKYHSKYSEVDF